MRLEFLESGPALIVENRERTLVVADLHFGIEFDLASQGWHFRSRSRDRLERVVAIAGETGPDRIVLLGDVKHGVPITSRQEFRELPAILGRLREECPVLIAPGNHDGGLERFAEEGEMLPMTGAVVDGVGYLHGHTYPDPSLDGMLLVAGHHHPFVFLKDEVGCALQAPAYLLAPLDDACIRAGRENRDTRTTSSGKLPGKPSGKTGKTGKVRKKNQTVTEGTQEMQEAETGTFETENFPSQKSGKGTRVLFVPAFNEYAGLDVLRIWKDPTSPLTRCMYGTRAEVFLADGTPLGPLASLGGDENARRRT